MKKRIDQVSLRLVREKSFYTTKSLNEPKQIAEVIGKKFQDFNKEQMIIINFDTALHLINFQVSSIGTINHTIASIGELVKAALLCNASSIIVMHNHPSGDTKPSPQDIETTEKIKEAFSLFEIQVLDHIIIGPNGNYFSMSEEGLMP